MEAPASRGVASGGQNAARKYRLIAELGHGGMADVFLAVAPGPAGFNKLVVIKQLRASLVEDEEFLRMFLDEARLVARLNHPNVIHTYEVGQDEALPYLAMEYLDGQPLHRIVQKIGRGEGGLPLEAMLRVLSDALVGLHYAHELCDYDGTPLNVVHRDVTPHNIFVTYEGAIKVVDFGIAKAMSQTAETRTGVIKGKIVYMAPEQAKSEDVDRRSDLFSMGVMLWEAATGRRLWKGMSDVTVLQRLVSGVPLPSPRSVNPQVPERIEQVCKRALAYSPGDRYATAAEMQADIEAYLETAPNRFSSHHVGKLLSERFSKEREAMQVTIDQQLRGMPSSTMSGSFTLPKLENSLIRTHFGAPVEDTPASGQVFGPPSGSGQLATGAAAIASVGGRASPPKRGLRVAAFAALGVSLVAVGGALAFGRLSLVSAGGRAGVEVRAPSDVGLDVRVTPAGAQLFLDDEPLGGSPYNARRARASGTHRLRAEAPGYLPKVKDISLGSDQVIELSLDREPASTAASAEAGKAAPAAPKSQPVGRWVPPPKPAPKPVPTTKQPKPGVTLDVDNPWKE